MMQVYRKRWEAYLNGRMKLGPSPHSNDYKRMEQEWVQYPGADNAIVVDSSEFRLKIRQSLATCRELMQLVDARPPDQEDD